MDRQLGLQAREELRPGLPPRSVVDSPLVEHLLEPVVVGLEQCDRVHSISLGREGCSPAGSGRHTRTPNAGRVPIAGRRRRRPDDGAQVPSRASADSATPPREWVPHDDARLYAPRTRMDPTMSGWSCPAPDADRDRAVDVVITSTSITSSDVGSPDCPGNSARCWSGSFFTSYRCSA